MDYPTAGTIFDALTRHDISWVNYHNVHPALVVLTRLLGAGRAAAAAPARASSAGGCPGVANAVRGNKSFTADLYPLGLARAVRHLRTTQQFFADAAAGTLPAVSIVDPDFGLYSEENPQDIAYGETFSAAVVNAVMHGPAWESTLLLWIYDEHGGLLRPRAAAGGGRRRTTCRRGTGSCRCRGCGCCSAARAEGARPAGERRRRARRPTTATGSGSPP